MANEFIHILIKDTFFVFFLSPHDFIIFKFIQKKKMKLTEKIEIWSWTSAAEVLRHLSFHKIHTVEFFSFEFDWDLAFFIHFVQFTKNSFPLCLPSILHIMHSDFSLFEWWMVWYRFDCLEFSEFSVFCLWGLVRRWMRAINCLLLL